MSWIHDVGGMHGFGLIDVDQVWAEGAAEEYSFDADWQLRLYALNRVLISKGVYTAAEFRHARERLPPDRYMSAPYYERVLLAVITLLEEKEIVASDDLAR